MNTYSRKIETDDRYFQINIVARTKTANFKVSHKEDLSEFRGHFFCIFMKNYDEKEHKLSIDELQTNTPLLREKVAEFVLRYRTELPMVNKLNDYFKLLKEGELFMIFPYRKLDKIEHFEVIKYLQSLETGENYEEILNDSMTRFGGVLDHYDISLFDENFKGSIGELDKTKRICRFCNNSREKISFKNAAHAISESLGNKRMFLNEECDECNSFFGTGIEQDLTTFLAIYLSFTGIKGKNGIIKIKGKNFQLANDGQILIDLTEPISDSDPFIRNLRLDSNSEISEQNIYRCLCKFALGFIERKDLQNFTKTTDWINGRESFHTLPKVAFRIEPENLCLHPIIAIHKRVKDVIDLPLLVVELRISIVRFAFIVPTFNDDHTDYTILENFSIYWNFFKYLSSLDNWTFLDFSNDTRKSVVYNLNFKIEKPIPHTDDSSQPSSS